MRPRAACPRPLLRVRAHLRRERCVVLVPVCAPVLGFCAGFWVSMRPNWARDSDLSAARLTIVAAARAGVSHADPVIAECEPYLRRKRCVVLVPVREDRSQRGTARVIGVTHLLAFRTTELRQFVAGGYTDIPRSRRQNGEVWACVSAPILHAVTDGGRARSARAGKRTLGPIARPTCHGIGRTVALRAAPLHPESTARECDHNGPDDQVHRRVIGGLGGLRSSGGGCRARGGLGRCSCCCRGRSRRRGSGSASGGGLRRCGCPRRRLRRDVCRERGERYEDDGDQPAGNEHRASLGQRSVQAIPPSIRIYSNGSSISEP